MHSGQIKIFNQPGFPWIFVGYFPSKKLPKLGGTRSCEVAIQFDQMHGINDSEVEDAKNAAQKMAREALTSTILDHHWTTPFLLLKKHISISIIYLWNSAFPNPRTLFFYIQLPSQLP